MKKMGKRLLAWVLALTMILTAQGTTAFAQTAGTEDAESNYIVTTVSDDSADADSTVTAVSEAISDDAEEATASASVMSTDTSSSSDAEEYFDEQFETALDSYSTGFYLDTDEYEITVDEYKEMYSEFLYDNYCYFYADPASYSWTANSSGVVTYVEITYKLDGEELDITDSSVQADLKEKVNELEAVITDILNLAYQGSDLKKALFVHDYLAQHCEYDLSYKKDTIYNALVEGTAVCEGYALAFMTLMREMDVNCEVVTISDYDGKGSGHMWNLVEVDGSWYHVDVTWDDPIYSGAAANDELGTDVLGRVEHYFFLKSTDYFQSKEVSGSKHVDKNGDDYVYSGSHTDEDASSDIYDEYFWDSVDSGFVYVDGVWYGLTTTEYESGLTEAYIYSYEINDGQLEPQELMLTISDYWTINDEGGYLKGNYTYLAAYDDKLYYNTNDTIYVYDPVYETATAIYSISDTKASNEFMYGFSIDESGNASYLLCSYSASSGISRVKVVTALNVENALGTYYELILSEDTYTYDGTAKTPEVTVYRISGITTTLTEGTDYTVAYSDNVNAGTATVTVTGIGNFEGTLTAEFTIEKADRTLTLKNASTGADITGSNITLEYAEYLYLQASVSAGDGSYSFAKSTSNVGLASKDSSKGTCTVQAASYSGSSVVTVTISETDNYEEASATVTINCSKMTRPISFSQTEVSLTAGGSSVQNKPGITEYTGDSSYTTTYSSSDKSVATVNSSGVVTSVGPGTCTITVTTSETDMCAQSSASYTVTVSLGSCSVSYINNTMYGLKVVWGKVSGASGYYIYIRNDDKTYNSTPTATVTNGSTTEWTDTRELTGGKDYTYKVVAYYKNSDGTITLGSTAGTTKTCKYLKWGVVESVTNTTTGVKVAWTTVTGANGYYIFRKSSSDSDYTQVATVGKVTSWTDTSSLTSGKNYTYKVSAIFTNSKGQVTKGGALTTKSIKYLAAGKISSLTNTSSGITVKWSKVSGASGYYVYRKTSSASKYTLVKTITSVGTVTYTDTAVKSKNGTTYIYYVMPYYKNSSGAVTKAAYTTKTTVRLTAVSLSSVTNSSSKKMTVKWAKNSKATGYEIQYSTSSSFSTGNKTVTVSGASSVSKVISSLTKGKTYYVRIRAYKTVSGTKYYSAWSSKKSVKISK